MCGIWCRQCTSACDCASMPTSDHELVLHTQRLAAWSISDVHKHTVQTFQPLSLISLPLLDHILFFFNAAFCEWLQCSQSLMSVAAGFNVPVPLPFPGTDRIALQQAIVPHLAKRKNITAWDMSHVIWPVTGPEVGRDRRLMTLYVSNAISVACM